MNEIAIRLGPHAFRGSRVEIVVNINWGSIRNEGITRRKGHERSLELNDFLPNHAMVWAEAVFSRWGRRRNTAIGGTVIGMKSEGRREPRGDVPAGDIPSWAIRGHSRLIRRADDPRSHGWLGAGSGDRSCCAVL
jgi:hypothetical protein